jgi:transcriptional regulator with XRE-family HTH domain
LDIEATQSGFGILVGISQQAVSKLVFKGVIPKAGTYREWLQAYTSSLRTTASGREEEASLTASRIREADASAALKELNFHKQAENLVEVAALEPLLASWAARGRSAVQAAEAKIIEGLESKYGLELDEQLVMEPLRSALKTIANYPSGNDCDVEAGGERVSATGTDPLG